MLADEDGIVVVPQKDVDEVLKRCQRNREVDARCMADLKQGRSIAETFKEHRGK